MTKSPSTPREKKRKNISIWRQNQTEFPLILISDRKYLRALSFCNFTEAKFKILPDIKQQKKITIQQFQFPNLFPEILGIRT